MKKLYCLNRNEYKRLEKIRIYGTYLSKVLDKCYVYNGFDNELTSDVFEDDYPDHPSYYLYADVTKLMDEIEELLIPWSNIFTAAKNSGMINLQYEIKRLNPAIIIPAYLSDMNSVNISGTTRNLPKEVINFFELDK